VGGRGGGFPGIGRERLSVLPPAALGAGEGAEDLRGGAAALDEVVGGSHGLAEALDRLFDDLLLPEGGGEGEEVADSCEGLGDVGLAEPEGEGGEGEIVGGGEGGRVGSLSEGLEEALFGGGEGGCEVWSVECWVWDGKRLGVAKAV
jgi:hypothetical protein